jgi:hypothetical protein
LLSQIVWVVGGWLLFCSSVVNVLERNIVEPLLQLVLQPVQLTAKIGLPLVERRNFGFLKFICSKGSFILSYIGVYIFSDAVNIALIIRIWLQHILLDLIPRNIDNGINRFLHLSAVAELVGLQFIFLVLSICPSARSWIDGNTVLF